MVVDEYLRNGVFIAAFDHLTRSAARSDGLNTELGRIGRRIRRQPAFRHKTAIKRVRR